MLAIPFDDLLELVGLLIAAAVCMCMCVYVACVCACLQIKYL